MPAVVRRSLVPLAVLVPILIGCASILGLEDIVVEPGTGASSGGTSGSSGTSGAATISCGEGVKQCGNTCVLQSLSYGCDASDCAPCKAGANAGAACGAAGCVQECADGGFADCNRNPGDGCEVQLTASDPNNCGACGKTCTEPTPLCASGTCVASCTAPLPTLCGSSCVDTNTSTTHCTRCNNACATGPFATAVCTGSGCAITCTAANRRDCNGNPGDGCEVDINSDAQNCGGCGLRCNRFPNVAPEGSTCVNGQCVLACQQFRAHCNSSLDDGCECDTFGGAICRADGSCQACTPSGGTGCTAAQDCCGYGGPTPTCKLPEGRCCFGPGALCGSIPGGNAACCSGSCVQVSGHMECN